MKTIQKHYCIIAKIIIKIVLHHHRCMEIRLRSAIVKFVAKIRWPPFYLRLIKLLIYQFFSNYQTIATRNKFAKVLLRIIDKSKTTDTRIEYYVQELYIPKLLKCKQMYTLLFHLVYCYQFFELYTPLHNNQLCKYLFIFVYKKGKSRLGLLPKILILLKCDSITIYLQETSLKSNCVTGTIAIS